MLVTELEQAMTTPNVSLLTGPPLVGIMLNWWLFGILCMQYYIYCTNPREDKKLLKVIVHGIFVVDTAQTILITHDAFYWYVLGFGDIDRFYNFKFASLDSPLLDAVIAFAVQLVYCWRIWKLSGWKVLPVINAFIAFIGFVGGIFCGAWDFKLTTKLNFDSRHRIPVLIWLFATGVTDIVIATTMSYLLITMGRPSIARNTRAKLTRLLLLTLETNTLTVAALAVLIVVYNVPQIAPPAS